MTSKLIPIDDKIIEDISTKLSEYLDLKDLIFENEFLEVFGDSFKVVNLLKTGHNLISIKKFNAFLKGFCYDDTPTDEQLLKLDKYIDNEKKAEFIADMFSKVLTSNSKLACMIMGIMINDLTEKDNNITHSQLICANALTSFFDDDIINYYHIIDFLDDLMLKRRNQKRYGFYEYNFRRFINETNNESSMYMTLNKAISHQLILSEPEIDASFDSDDVELSSVEVNTFFLVTDAGKLLSNYISKIASYINN